MDSPCLQDAQLLAMLEGSLSPAESRSVREHLDGCAPCRDLIAGLAGTDLAASLAAPGATEPAWSSAGFTPPSAIGPFRIDELLGRGAMGTVYAGQDTLLDRPVAIKFLHVSDSQSREWLLREARAIARLHHPNVVTLFQVGELGDRPYLIYELVAGQSLDWAQKPLPWSEVYAIALDIARGLAEAHRRGVVHRDLKPANVVRTPEGVAKLLDFGLARMSRAPAPPAATVALAGDGPVTSHSGAIVGTPRYMAPEVWAGQPPIPAVDVYSAGALLFELAAGRPAHEEKTLVALAASTVNQPAPALATVCPQAPPAFAAVIDRCLQRDPALRYPDGAALLAALQETTATTAARSGSRLRVGVLGGLLGCAALTLGLGLAARRPPPPGTLPRVPPPPGTLVRVPGTTFEMGSTADEIAAAQSFCVLVEGAKKCPDDIFKREQPRRRVQVSSFVIDATEATVAQFAAWLNQQPRLVRAANDPEHPEHPYLFQDGVPLINLFPSHLPPLGLVTKGERFVPAPGRERHPIIQVTWHGALRYCRSRGLRLPTEAEWELAARGPQGNLFPWGADTPRCEDAVFWRREDVGWEQKCRALGHDVAEVATHPRDRSVYGVYDLAGNLSEWVMDQFRDSYASCGPPCIDPQWDPPQPQRPVRRVFRGGDYAVTGAHLRGAARSRWDQDIGLANVGFRCAGPAPP